MIENERSMQGFPFGKRKVVGGDAPLGREEVSLESQGLSSVSSVSSEVTLPPPEVRKVNVMRKKKKIIPHAITGTKFNEDGTTDPLTKSKQVDPAHVPTVRPKKKADEKAAQLGQGVALTPGLEFTDELLAKLGKLHI